MFYSPSLSQNMSINRDWRGIHCRRLRSHFRFIPRSGISPLEGIQPAVEMHPLQGFLEKRGEPATMTYRNIQSFQEAPR